MCLGDCIKKHVFKMTTFLFIILFVIMVILYVKEKNVSQIKSQEPSAFETFNG